MIGRFLDWLLKEASSKIKLDPEKRQSDRPRQVIDYRERYWGHTFNFNGDDSNPKNLKGHGFYGYYYPFNMRRIEAGDFFAMKGRMQPTCFFRVVSIRYESDPRDMFWATVEAIGVDENGPLEVRAWIEMQNARISREVES